MTAEVTPRAGTAPDVNTAAALDRLVPMERIGPSLAAETGDERWSRARATLITGGKSNLTFLLTSAAGELVLRRPPDGPLLATAHDMAREARVQQALARTSVPVARVVIRDDGAVMGVPFYVMDRVDGHVVRDHLPAGFAEQEHERRGLANVLIDTLADLHTVDPHAAGLEDFGRPAGFAARQIRRWTQRWEASQFEPVAAVDTLARALAASVPDKTRPGIVHGDYRIDNCILDPADPARIAAVLDWEMSTLGDPLTDLGMLLLYWREPGERQISLTPTVTHLPGFPRRAELVDRYTARVGGVHDLGWYHAFAHFKFAVITQGIAARVATGSMAGQDFGDLTTEVLALADEGHAVLRSASD